MTSDLITRLSKLEGPDREIDAEIGVELGLFITHPNAGWPDRLDYGRLEADGSITRPGHGFDQLIPPYTASVDADIRLADRVLPEHYLIIHTSGFAEARHCEKRLLDASGHGATAAIAAVIAILRAKEATHGE